MSITLLWFIPMHSLEPFSHWRCKTSWRERHDDFLDCVCPSGAFILICNACICMRHCIFIIYIYTSVIYIGKTLLSRPQWIIFIYKIHAERIKLTKVCAHMGREEIPLHAWFPPSPLLHTPFICCSAL